MKILKEAPLVLKNRTVVLFCIFLLNACAHNFEHRKLNAQKGTIEQVLKVKIRNKNEQEKLTIYTSIDRNKKEAVLDGVGRLDKHVFTLEIKNNEYILNDHINGHIEAGKINDFKLVPLDQETVFTKLDKNSEQPIILQEPERDIYVEIKVVEQMEHL